ncbi:hypothetical protein [Mucilaginibacter segetis]|uniref:Uncharacterized protein n=1 Tax=Mucilaginibacter segetis TaxID=2793071 RepID=A0A934PPY6_9SPHI|nr:hypothetical protein [Mucilaginibacter segetis]MBK0378604.1 hypothetical protein [Mucilaginibacter segetis]
MATKLCFSIDFICLPEVRIFGKHPKSHAEFISASHMQGYTCEILKQVQDDW